MRLVVGRNNNSVEFFDNDGNPIEVHARLIDIKLRPGEATTAVMEVYFDHMDINLIDDLIDARRVGHRK